MRSCNNFYFAENKNYYEQKLKLKQLFCSRALSGKTVSYTFTENYKHVLVTGVVGSGGTGNEFWFNSSADNIMLASTKFNYPPSGEFKTYLLTDVKPEDYVSLHGYVAGGNQSILTIYAID